MNLTRTALCYLLLALLCVGCDGGTEGKFRIKGKFSNLREGMFYVYSPDHGKKLDTVSVRGGEFSYTTNTDEPATYILIYPNFSEQVVFGGSGEVAKLKGDASRLRAVEISGSPDNEELTRFRLDNIDTKEEQMVQPVAKYIAAHPASRTSAALFYRYFVQDEKADPKERKKLAEILKKNQPKNELVKLWATQSASAVRAVVGNTAPSFSVRTTNDKTLTLDDLRKKNTVISFWASWSDESLGNQRVLRQWQKKYGSKLNLLSVSLDVNPSSMRTSARLDSLTWNAVCDFRAWGTPLVQAFGVSDVPHLIVISPNLQIKWRGAKAADAKKIVEQLVK